LCFYQIKIINWEFLDLVLGKKDMIWDWEWGLISGVNRTVI